MYFYSSFVLNGIYFTQIVDIPGRETLFRVAFRGTNHVIFESTDPELNCVRVCYRGNEGSCGERSIENSYVEIDSLAPLTSYTFILSECSSTKTHYNEFTVQTEPDGKFNGFSLHDLNELS